VLIKEWRLGCDRDHREIQFEEETPLKRLGVSDVVVARAMKSFRHGYPL
jgi:hypothetical protein